MTMEVTLALLVCLVFTPITASAGSFKDLVREVSLNAPVEQWPADLAALVGFSGDQSTRVKAVDSADTSDGRERYCRLIYQKGSPAALVFLAYHEDLQAQEMKAYFYRTTLAGKLERAVSTDGKLDPNGEPIAGTNQDRVLALTDEGTRSNFRRELDFWLRGKFRKAKAARAASRNSSQPLAASK